MATFALLVGRTSPSPATGRFLAFAKGGGGRKSCFACAPAFADAAKLRTSFASARFFCASSDSQERESFVKVEDKGKVRWVTLNRPKTHNAFNEFVIQDITKAFAQVEEQVNKGTAPCDMVVLTGEGPSFSAGADLNWMKKMINYTQEQNEKDSYELFDMFHTIQSCPIPVIGRVNGSALGGGSGLVSVCDFAFSVSTAQFGFTEVKLGLIPAVISPFVMEKIGKTHASRYFLTGERFGAEEAKRIGLISAYFESVEKLDEYLLETLLGKEMLNNSPVAMRSCKNLIRTVSQSYGTNPLGMKSDLASRIAKARVSESGQEGVSAFLERRKPKWSNK
ncbi:putative Enoyl-CoA hydratase, membrane protein [Balamuthia mandrillaris]